MATAALCDEGELPQQPGGDYLSSWADELDVAAIRAARHQALRNVRLPFWEPHRELLRRLPGAARSSRSMFSEAEVRLGIGAQLSKRESAVIDEGIELLQPWRKGPFEVCGKPIDAEWRSDFKWSRVEQLAASISGKRVADIGCGNGYYMFRMQELGPQLVVGMDPSDRFYYQFQFLQHFAQCESLAFEPFGVEHAPLFNSFFDAVFCMGVIYHRPDPIGMLRDLRQCLQPGGLLVLESQAIPGDAHLALFPEERYAKARNVYFVPTAGCLANWVRRAGFAEVEVCSSVKVTAGEQRRTEQARFESLEDFLDPEDRSRTIEGYPAPLRVIVKAIKPGR